MKVTKILTAAALLTVTLVAGTASAQYNGLQNSRFGGNTVQPELRTRTVNIGGNAVEIQYFEETGRRPIPTDPYGGSGRIGGSTSPRPFSEIKTDARGQRWKVQGFRWTVAGRPMERVTSRTPLRNGVQFDTGKNVDHDLFDPYSGTFHRKTSQTKIYDSASDIHRNHVDGGRKTYVNRIEIDPRTGERVRVTGYEWTSYGKYHADLKRTKIRVNGFGDTDVEEEHRVMAPAPRP